MKTRSEKNTQMKALDKKFWSHFSQTAWQKKAMAYKNLHSPMQQIDQDRVFQMLVDYSQICRQRNTAEGFKLYLEGERQHELDTLQFLPLKKDKSLLGYHQRMEKLFPDYCLVCDELLQVSRDSLQGLTEFTEGLYQQIGFPNRFSELGLYLGNYKKTPFGVHIDGCGVFSFPVVGTKKFRLWSPQYVKKNPDLIEAHQYDEFKKHSQVLIAKPGDMTYWPSQAWHIAESDGSFNATWSLGVWVDLSHEEIMIQTLRPLLNKKLGPFAGSKTTAFRSIHQKSGQMTSLPSSYQRMISILKNLSQAEIHDQFLMSWMATTSRQGLKNFPKVQSPQKLNAHSILKNILPSSILWTKLTDQKTHCFAFAGQIFLQRASIKFLKLIEDLNSGHTCHLEKYLKGPALQKELHLLQKLSDAGAFWQKPVRRKSLAKS